MNMEIEQKSLSMALLMEKLVTEDKPVCCYQDKIINGRQFYTHIHNFADQLRGSKGTTWALFCDEAYLFAVAFFAAILCGKRLIILPNNQPETLESIKQYAQGMLTDVEDGMYKGGMQVVNVRLSELPQLEYSSKNIQALISNIAETDKEQDISLYTSGSTGKAKQITKKLQHFFAEIAALESVWGAYLGQSQFVSTVSHQHIYGLLCRIFWPLCCGRLWHSSIIRYPEELQQYSQKQHSQNSPLIMISSPAFLKRVSSDQQFLKQAAVIGRIFSSGGLLDEASSVALQSHLSVPVIEVLGSTETGGVAYRQQSAQQMEPWTPLPGVDVMLDDASGQLTIQSVYCYTTERFVMGDLVEFVDERRFHLLGRSDRIVKIEEKRISLPEMEAWLGKHEYVTECHLILLKQTHRDILGAVVVLTDHAKQLLARDGRQRINKYLKDHLTRKFEAVTLPRKWRYEDVIPANAQGKIINDELQKIFYPGGKGIPESSPDSAEDVIGLDMTNGSKPIISNDKTVNHDSKEVCFPCVRKVEKEEQSLVLTLFIPLELMYFDGHFPQAPVLPGVVQLHWVIYYAEKYFGIEIQSQKLEVLKFQQIIPPEIELDLTINYKAKTNKLFFSYQSAIGSHSSGRIVLNEPFVVSRMPDRCIGECEELLIGDNL